MSPIFVIYWTSCATDDGESSMHQFYCEFESQEAFEQYYCYDYSFNELSSKANDVMPPGLHIDDVIEPDRTVCERPLGIPQVIVPNFKNGRLVHS